MSNHELIVDANVWNSFPEVAPKEGEMVVVLVGIYPQIAIYSSRYQGGWALIHVRKDLEYKSFVKEGQQVYWTRSPLKTIRYKKEVKR